MQKKLAVAALSAAALAVAFASPAAGHDLGNSSTYPYGCDVDHGWSVGGGGILADRNGDGYTCYREGSVAQPKDNHVHQN
jgi:hypothetical protein